MTYVSQLEGSAFSLELEQMAKSSVECISLEPEGTAGWMIKNPLLNMFLP